MPLNEYGLAAFKHFIDMYKTQWDLNQYARDNYNEDLEYYIGYRPQQRYPLAYSEVFNKLLPKIMVTLSRFMEQLYQAGTGDLVSVRPRKRTDVDRAPRVQGLLNYQLETLNEVDMHGGSYLFNFQWLFNAVSFGKGIAKLYWRKEERIAPTRQTIPVPIIQNGQIRGFELKDVMDEAPQMVYNGPYAEVLHNKLFVPHPYYRNIQKMPAVFCVYQRTIDYIKKMADKGVYELQTLNDLGWGQSPAHSGTDTVDGRDSGERFAKSIEIEGAVSTEQILSDRLSPLVDVIEGYGKYIFPEDEAPYEVGSGLKIKGPESEAIVHIGNYKTILKIQKNKYGYRPFFDIGAYYHPELFWDIGILRLGKGIQEIYNDLANSRVQNAMMLVNQMLKVREYADIDPASLVAKPFGVIPVEEMADVEPLVVPDAAQAGVFREQEQFFDDTLAEMTGMYPYNMGATPPRQEHVGTMYSLQSMGESRTKLLLMTMDHTGFKPFLKYMMLLNMFHLPSQFETRISSDKDLMFQPLFSGDIHFDYDFSARYTGMEPALGKQFRAQQLIQYAQMWSQSPYLQHYQFMKAVLELLDFHDSDKYVKSPEQLQQEQQMAQQAEMQGMLAQHNMELQGDKELQGQKITGDLLKTLIK